ncbi:hypothetical protein LG634_32360 [Streptomyces bambusae]|uniref:hypothetical protein n=1 Tax=Streptomyces bambusae TaxID=1550616 RepID=UPI001D001514|nr:hypothetical protein [Streptomyces bambusae]MCB5169487.1 hypothetical protein [Streptomyces bambusae]
MAHVLLFGFVVPLTAVLCGVLLWRRRADARARQRAGLRDDPLVVDPYHLAHGTAWPRDDVQAAAAQLVRDGLVRVNHRGTLILTPAGRDPARTAGHPLPDGLLKALRSRTAGAPLGALLLYDAEYAEVRRAFHAAWQARLEARRPPEPRQIGCLGVCGMVGVFVLMTVEMLAFFDRILTEPLVAVVLAAVFAGQFAWVAQYRDEPEPVPHWSERPLHPALAALDRETYGYLFSSRQRIRRTRNRGRPRSRRASAQP